MELVPVSIESDVKSPDSQLLDMIYSVDPVTGLPSSDFTYFESSNASPEVRQFIQNQIHSVRPPQNDCKLTDDERLVYGRAPDESPRQYLSRVRSLLQSEREKVHLLRSDNKKE